MSTRRFEDYEDDVRRYGWSWFQQDAQALAVVQEVAEVRRQAFRLAAGHETVGTEVLYRAGERWVEQRVSLHEKLVAKALVEAGVDPSEGDHPALPPVPQAVLLLGLPGSGKSSRLRPVAHSLIRRVSPTPGVAVDADVVRGLFPEYAAGLGSEVVQEETSKVANGPLIDEALRRRAHLILDKVGHPERTLAAVDFLNRTGWVVWCLCARVDLDVALDRAKQRAIETGRYVPSAYIRDVASQPVEAYEALCRDRAAITGCAMLDTTELGERPRVIHSDPESLFGGPGELVGLWPDGNGSDA